MEELKRIVDNAVAQLRSAASTRHSRSVTARRTRKTDRKDDSCNKEPVSRTILSYILSNRSWIQNPHQDIAKGVLSSEECNQEQEAATFVAFFPLTKAGMFLQLWDLKRQGEGILVYLPINYMLVVPGNTVHSGGFMSSANGNPRCHLYVYKNIETRLI